MSGRETWLHDAAATCVAARAGGVLTPGAMGERVRGYGGGTALTRRRHIDLCRLAAGPGC